MTTSFGGSDAEGAWSWRDAYDAIEAALVLQLRRLAPQIGRLEDAPAEIVALLAAVSRARPDPHPPQRGAGRAGPVLHPARARAPWPCWPPRSARATWCWSLRPAPACWRSSPRPAAAPCSSTSWPPHRAALLDGLFPAPRAPATTPCICSDLLPASGGFHAVLANPPFQHLEAHLHAAIDCLADGGRLSAIVPGAPVRGRAALRALAAPGPHRRCAGLPRPRLRQARDLGRDRPAGARPWRRRR